MRDVHDVVIGLDFGTSCTKVVIQDHAQGQAWGVPFPGVASPSNPYLIPSRIWLDGDSACLESASGREPVADIKRPLLNRGEDDSAKRSQVLVTVYLSLVLRRARAWLLEKKGKLYGSARIQWLVNLGIPSAGYADLEDRAVFLKLAKAAWLLSFDGDPVSLKAAARLLAERHIISGGMVEMQDISVVPEVIAEVIGYALSTQRDPGLHLIVDVGAGTVDVAAFLLEITEDLDHRYSILTAKVQRLGAYELHEHRMREIEARGDVKSSRLSKAVEPLGAIPDLEVYQREGYLSHSDLPFGELNQTLIRRTIYCVKKRREPNSPRWRTSLPVFLCGGGGSIDLYKIALDRAVSELSGYGVRQYHLQDLPMPERLEARGLTAQGYHRLGVAWGLSFARYNIGEILSPDEILDKVGVIVRPPSTAVDYVGPEQI